jgi:hypothetical protein
MLPYAPVPFEREFVGSLQVVRFGITPGTQSPVLVFKALTLTLKQVIAAATLHVLLTSLPTTNHLLYALTVEEDPVHPAHCWSLAETAEELHAITRILQGVACDVLLLNEHNLKVCSTTVHFTRPPQEPHGSLGKTVLCPLGASSQFKLVAHAWIDDPNRRNAVELRATACIWHEQQNILLGKDQTTSRIAILSGNEGDQQEELAVWLADLLDAPTLVKRPQVQDGTTQRELCDALLNYKHGAVLIESKGLSILQRTGTPSRKRLKQSMCNHVDKAIKQLTGAWQRVVRGIPVTTGKGNDVPLTRNQPAHCLIVVPDLSLLDDATGLGGHRVREFRATTQCFLHLLDLAQLRNTVLNAHSIARQSKQTSPIMVFDGILLKRWEFSLEQPTPYFTVRLTVVPEQ